MILKPDASTFAIYPWPAFDGGRKRAYLRTRHAGRIAVRRLPRTHAAAAPSKTQPAFFPGLKVGWEVEFYLFDQRQWRRARDRNHRRRVLFRFFG